MASLDKSSVRDEVNNLKAQFEQLSAEGKLSGEAKVLFSRLLLIVDLILSIFLEKQTPKNARNSSVRETVTLAQVEHCDVCGEPLTDVPCTHHERRTKIDILFEKVIEHMDAEVKRCPNCQATVKGEFPPRAAVGESMLRSCPGYRASGSLLMP